MSRKTVSHERGHHWDEIGQGYGHPPKPCEGSKFEDSSFTFPGHTIPHVGSVIQYSQFQASINRGRKNAQDEPAAPQDSFVWRIYYAGVGPFRFRRPRCMRFLGQHALGYSHERHPGNSTLVYVFSHLSFLLDDQQSSRGIHLQWTN